MDQKLSNSEVYTYRTPINFQVIAAFFFTNFLVAFFSFVFFKDIYVTLILLVLLNSLLFYGIKKIIINDEAIIVSTMLAVYQYKLNQLQYVKINHIKGKFSQSNIIFKFKNKRFVLSFPDSEIRNVRNILTFLRNKKIDIIIDSNLPFHDELKVQ